MNVTDTRLKIAVFIDFDNVEIGVKSTIGGQFDIGLVLEAIKERGEIVTKIAYSDWKRAGDYSRLLTLHAIRMVQRNLTPGGDKNGADITMALDALEMAFTHDHINAFVIVGGDSDFISLVEKLKQYDRKVIVVGGRQFTSVTMQRNCHEFIAYENLMGSSRGRSIERGARPAATSSIAQALPVVKRALKVLSEREVTPQLGLLKSTLLQLDSTFSERDYGASSFRDFMEKVAEAGAVTLRQAGRSLLVEPRESGMPIEQPADVAARVAAQAVAPAREAPAAESEDEETEIPTSPMSMADGVRAVQFAISQGNPRWPMYVRQARQYLKNSIEGFDERKYGFTSVVDLLRACAKEGVLRVERDRQGGMRVFPGANLKQAGPASVEEVDAAAEAPVEAAPVVVEPEVATEPPIIDAEPVEPIEAPIETVTVEEPPKRGGRRRKATSGGSKRKVAKSVAPKHRARRGRSKSEAAQKATRIA
ncbi:MAG TPA: NYN domain-containing protein [Vicinamibacterales bacterium]|jgi:uncharacterized LabA/DUF88 family protein|nr:NYN domain-containing protein [Vicinamibacterales bacterium]